MLFIDTCTRKHMDTGPLKVEGPWEEDKIKVGGLSKEDWVSKHLTAFRLYAVEQLLFCTLLAQESMVKSGCSFAYKRKVAPCSWNPYFTLGVLVYMANICS